MIKRFNRNVTASAARNSAVVGTFCDEVWFYYNEVIMSAMPSQITSLIIIYSNGLFSRRSKKKVKAARHWPLWGEFTGDRWIPRTKGQWRGKCFHLMTSSWLCRSMFPLVWRSGLHSVSAGAYSPPMYSRLTALFWSFNILQQRPLLPVQTS